MENQLSGLLERLEELEEEISDFGFGFDTEDVLQEMEAQIQDLSFNASSEDQETMRDVQNRIDKLRLVSDADLL